MARPNAACLLLAAAIAAASASSASAQSRASRGPDADVIGLKLGMAPADVRSVFDERGGVRILGHGFPVEVLVDGRAATGEAASLPERVATLESRSRGRVTHQTPGGTPCDAEDAQVLCIPWLDWKRAKGTGRYRLGRESESASVRFHGGALPNEAWAIRWTREFYDPPSVEATQVFRDRWGQPSAVYAQDMLWMWGPQGQRLDAVASPRGRDIAILTPDRKGLHPCAEAPTERGLPRADAKCGRTLRLGWTEDAGRVQRMTADYFDHVAAVAEWNARAGSGAGR